MQMNVQKPRQIMVVDDEPQMTKLLRMILIENIECEVEVFNDSVAALERLRQKKFDLVSLDFRMPKMTGIELVTAVRMNEGPNRHTPILLFTGFRQEAETLGKELIEDLLFLEKPVENSRYIAQAKMALMMGEKDE